MNKIGRNKRSWLEKQGCIFKDDEYGTQIYTQHGEYVSMADLGEKAQTVNFIYKHRLTNLMSVNRALGLPLSTTVSVGFNEKEQAWYGWTHRGYGKFYIGCVILDRGPHKRPFKVETLDRAKELAARFADFLK